MDLIGNLQSFLRVAETGSFSAVAAQKGVTQPAISRQVSALEEYFGARLVQRSTQAVTLTDEGRNLLPAAQELVDAAEGIRHMTGRWVRNPVGCVRVAVPDSLNLHVSERISTLLGRYDELTIELIMRDASRSLIEEGLDLEVRVGPVEDASLTCRRVGCMSPFLVAAPSYLDRRPAIHHPRDLAGHDCVVHQRQGKDSVWSFTDTSTSTDGDGEWAISVSGRFRTDSESAARRAALSGQGIACLSHLIVSDDIAQSRLFRLLPEFRPRQLPIYVAYPSRRRLPHRTRAVIDFLVKLLQEDPLLRL